MKKLTPSEIRSQLKLPSSIPKDVKFKLAETPEEYLESFRILYECYVEKGYTEANTNYVRLTPYHLLPSTAVMLVLWKGEIVGTMSLIRDNPLGLPLESIFDLKPLRKKNEVLCEVSSLAIKKDFRGKAGEIFYPFVRFMWMYALTYFGVDTLVIAVNPSMSDLYESIFLFKLLNKKSMVDQYSFANNNPAVGQYMPIKHSLALFKETYDSTTAERNLYRFMLDFRNESSAYPDKKYKLIPPSPVRWTWFTQWKTYLTDIFQNPNVTDRLAKAFGFKVYDSNSMSPFENEQRSREKDLNLLSRRRWLSDFKVLNQRDSQILDVSPTGLKISSSTLYTMNVAHVLSLQLSESIKATILIKVVWHQRSDDNYYLLGCEILESSPEWQSMVEDTLLELSESISNRAA